MVKRCLRSLRLSLVPDGEVPVCEAGVGGASGRAAGELQRVPVPGGRSDAAAGGPEPRAGGDGPGPHHRPHPAEENPLLHPAAHQRHGTHS